MLVAGRLMHTRWLCCWLCHWLRDWLCASRCGSLHGSVCRVHQGWTCAWLRLAGSSTLRRVSRAYSLSVWLTLWLAACLTWLCLKRYGGTDSVMNSPSGLAAIGVREQDGGGNAVAGTVHPPTGARAGAEPADYTAVATSTAHLYVLFSCAADSCQPCPRRHPPTPLRLPCAWSKRAHHDHCGANRFERYAGGQAGGDPSYNPLTDYGTAVDGAPGSVDCAEASGGAFAPSTRGLGRRGSTYNGFDDVADAEA